MICKKLNDWLLIQSVDGAQTCNVDISSFCFISGVALEAIASSLAMTAVPRGKRPPNLSAHFKGDIGLFVCDLRRGEWRTVCSGYAHDPAWFPDRKRLAFYSGKAICSAAAEGDSLEEHFNLGRYTWGPPSVSVSPDGSKIGFVKWKGDDRHLGVCNVQTGEGRVYPVSCYHYAWLDNETIVYSLGSGLKTLDVATGRTSLFLRDAQALRRIASLSESIPALEERLRSEPAPTIQEVTNPKCHGGRLYFVIYVADQKDRYLAVGSLRADRSDFQQHFFHRADRVLIRDFYLLNEARTIAVRLEFYNARVSLSHTEIRYVGKGAVRIPSGYVPLPTIPSPDFGFHYMGQCDRGERKPIGRFFEPIARLLRR